MAKGIIKTLRNNWKKSVFGSIAFIWGSSYLAARYRDEIVRRQFCLRAKEYGDQKTYALEKPRKIYVVLNCEGSKGKAKKLYEKTAAPILHLSGIDVTLIKTDYEGHAKAIVNYLDPSCDGLVVAGGDGTIMETVTGLLRLADFEDYKDMPFGVLPLGKNNTFFQKIFPTSSNQVRDICNSAMAIVEGKCRFTDVLEIKTDKRNVYALSSFHWGAYERMKERFDAGRMWWTGILRKYILVLYATFKDKDSGVSGDIKYVNKSDSNRTEVIENASCSSMVAYVERDATKDSAMLKLQTWPTLSFTDFIKEGLKLIDRKFWLDFTDESQVCEVETIELTPVNLSNFDIDGEAFDSQPVQISLHKEKIKVFCPMTETSLGN